MKAIVVPYASKRIFIDIGSSTVKVYLHQKEKVEMLFTRSIPFKEGFDAKSGLPCEVGL